MKRLLLLVTILVGLLVYTPAVAQIVTGDDAERSDQVGKPSKMPRQQVERLWKWDNFFIGGIPGFGISNQFVVVTGAVEGGYFIHPHISVGGRFVYQYYLDKFFNDRLHIFGGGPFARGYIWRGIFAQLEYESTRIRNVREVNSLGNTIRFIDITVNAVLLGGGYHGNHESGFGYYIELLFNVINTEQFVYPNPVIRFGLTYRFLPR